LGAPERGRRRPCSVPVLTFSHNWAIVEGWQVEFGHLWSVAVEAQFYALWAVVVVAALRTPRPHAVLAAAAGAGIVAVAVWRFVRFDGGEHPFDLYVSTGARLDAPLVGSLAGVVASARWLPWFRGRVAAAAGSLGLLLLVVASSRANFLDGLLYRGLFTAIAVCAAVIVLAAVRAAPGGLTRALSFRPLVAAGLISYSLYVWHLPIFQMLSRNTRPWQPQPRAVVGVVVSLAVAVLSYRFVERPFLRRRAGAQANPKAKQRSPSSPNA
jgi:peptidoglycan/LPS O-acetylase OafA/YrhL